DGGVICDGALPIDIFGSGPIGRELGHLEASFWRNLKGGGSSQSDFADPAASKHIETHVIRALSRPEELFSVAQASAEIESLETRAEPRRGIQLLSAVALVRKMHVSVGRKPRSPDLYRRIERQPVIAQGLSFFALQVKIVCNNCFGID